MHHHHAVPIAVINDDISIQIGADIRDTELDGAGAIQLDIIIAGIIHNHRTGCRSRLDPDSLSEALIFSGIESSLRPKINTIISINTVQQNTASIGVTAHNRIIASITRHGVGAITADQRVSTTATKDRIRAAITTQHISAGVT